MSAEPVESQRSTRAYVPWVIGAVALVAFVGGAAATLRGLRPTDAPAGDGAIVSAKEFPTAIHDRKSPDAFGFPRNPDAFDFHSMVADAKSGSASFLLHHGTAADVEKYYVEALGGKGWIFLWTKPVDVKPDQKRPLVFHGRRARWVNEEQHRELTLLTLDDHQKGHSAQAVLTWEPVETKKD